MEVKQHRTIFHIDMNAFFASCEQVTNKELRNKPIIVGGDPTRRSGIVLAASYEAKRKGVKTASTLYAALKLCPEAIVVRPTHGLYSEFSKRVMDLFDTYTPLKEQLSIDEAFLDMTGTEHLFGEPKVAAARIQNHILEEIGLPSSVGISSNKLLAKMGSELKKPMGITTLYPEEIQEKLWHLPIGDLYGIGRKTVPKLQNIGIMTIGDLAKADVEKLAYYFTTNSAISMIGSANGKSSDKLDSQKKVATKSIGNELTYGENITDIDSLKREILKLSDKVAFRLRKKKYKCRTITLKIKYSDFSVITRSKTISKPTDGTDAIYKKACELAIKHIGSEPEPIRLIGVTLSNFEEEQVRQLSLFQDEEDETREVDIMVDEIRGKFGYGAIKKAGLLKKKQDDLEE